MVERIDFILLYKLKNNRFYLKIVPEKPLKHGLEGFRIRVEKKLEDIHILMPIEAGFLLSQINYSL